MIYDAFVVTSTDKDFISIFLFALIYTLKQIIIPF